MERKESRGLVNELAIPTTTEIVPWTAADLAKAGTKLAQALIGVAQLTLEKENPQLTMEYTGAEREAMISERALKLHSLMELAMDAAGQELVESLKQNGPFHPDIRGDSQELVDELVSKGDQWKRAQGWYIVHEIFPKAEELGVNLERWKTETSYTKLREICPDFRFVMEDKELSEEERADLFLSLVALSTKQTSEIRASRQYHEPREFFVYEKAKGQGVSWEIPYLDPMTRNWIARRLQPWLRIEESALTRGGVLKKQAIQDDEGGD